VERVRLALAGRTVFHASWAVVPRDMPAALRLGGAGSRDGSVRICASEPAEVLRDVALRPGEVQTVRFEATLPRGAPPSYHGTAIRHAYTLTATAKLRGAAQEVTVVQPVRVPLAAAEPWRSAEGDSAGSEGGGGCFVSHRYDAAAPPVPCRWERSVMAGVPGSSLAERGLATSSVWSPKVDAHWIVEDSGGGGGGDGGGGGGGWGLHMAAVAQQQQHGGDRGGGDKVYKIAVGGEHVVSLTLRGGTTVGCGQSLLLDLDFGAFACPEITHKRARKLFPVAVDVILTYPLCAGCIDRRCGAALPAGGCGA
jgi:hypothetical protein